MRTKLLHHDYWKVVECIQGERRCLEVVEADDSDLVVCRIPVITEQTKREASVIAAAPDLLRACKAAMQISALWSPPELVSPEHEGEAEALWLMKQAFVRAITKAEQKR